MTGEAKAQSRRAEFLWVLGMVLLGLAGAAALLDSATTYIIVSEGLGREGNPALAALVNGQPLWVFPCAMLLLAPLPFLPELPRLVAASGFAAAHGTCALSNLALLVTGSAPLSGATQLLAFIALPALSALYLTALLKLAAPRGTPALGSLAWLAVYALYIVGMGFAFRLLGGALGSQA